jgi:hypothetical protein
MCAATPRPPKLARVSLSTGIVSLPNVGKSTLFNALTWIFPLRLVFPGQTLEARIGPHIPCVPLRTRALLGPGQLWPALRSRGPAGIPMHSSCRRRAYLPELGKADLNTFQI